MNSMMLLLPILCPAVLALLVFIVPKSVRWLMQALTVLSVTVSLVWAVFAFGQNVSYQVPWTGLGIDFALRLYSFSGFILAAVSGFSFLIVIYSFAFMKEKGNLKLFYGLLLVTQAMVSGAVLANNLVVLLFFWEGLLATLFGMIMTGGRQAAPVAVKALVLSGVADLCMMLGIGLTIYLSGGVGALDKIHLPLDFWGSFAFLLLCIGATAKTSLVPFHSWIPDAAKAAPLPFMAFLPAALEKLLGVYFLARITLNLFDLHPGSTMSIVLMTLGVVSLLVGAIMALGQKDFKRMLAYSSISQGGYIVLAIGTALPVGIAAGLFHMINHAMYKSTLFLTGGAVERQAGTTELDKLGGLGRKMPVTFITFIIAGAAISGVPPFSGFFSKELIFDSAMESGWIFYAAALFGAFLTAAYLLKLGHAVFGGKKEQKYEKVKEAPAVMLIPMLVIAAGCILFGVYNQLPLERFIQPILGARFEESFVGWPHNTWLVIASLAVLALAVLNHVYGVSRTKRGAGALDHILYAPGIKQMYAAADKGYFDPYNIGMAVVNAVSKLLYWIDRGIDWIYNVLCLQTARSLSRMFKEANSGSYVSYIGWSLAGLLILLLAILVY